VSFSQANSLFSKEIPLAIKEIEKHSYTCLATKIKKLFISNSTCTKVGRVKLNIQEIQIFWVIYKELILKNTKKFKLNSQKLAMTLTTAQ
jgi:hypothetical protein